MPETVTVTEMSRKFADCMNRVRYRRERFFIKKGKDSFAELKRLPRGLSGAEFLELVKNGPHLDPEVAREHARIYSELRTSGRLIGVHDQWLAAVCLVNDFTMVTGNIGEFSRVSGPKVENWKTEGGQLP